VKGPAAGYWLATNESTFLPKFSEPCPGNENVNICDFDGLDYKLTSVDTEAADWLLSLDSGDVLPGTDGKCPGPEVTPAPEPEVTPTPEPEETPTPEPKDDDEDDTDASAPEPKNPDAEVLGKTETREFALTGTESSELALYGFSTLFAGLMLVGAGRWRRAVI
jgi:hypothetical protein